MVAVEVTLEGSSASEDVPVDLRDGETEGAVVGGNETDPSISNNWPSDSLFSRSIAEVGLCSRMNEDAHTSYVLSSLLYCLLGGGSCGLQSLVGEEMVRFALLKHKKVASPIA